MRKTTRNKIIEEAEAGLWTLEDLRRVRRSKKAFSILIKTKEGKDAFFAQTNDESKLIELAIKYGQEISTGRITIIFNGIQRKNIPFFNADEMTEQEREEYQRILKRGENVQRDDRK